MSLLVNVIDFQKLQKRFCVAMETCEVKVRHFSLKYREAVQRQEAMQQKLEEKELSLQEQK